MKKIGLFTEIILITFGLVFILGFTAIISIKSILQKHIYEELKKKAIYQAENLEKEISAYLKTNNITALQIQINDHKNRDKDIEYIFILNSKGKVLAHTFENGFPVKLKGVNIKYSQTHNIRHITNEKGGIFEIALPVLKGNLGVVHIGISEESTKKAGMHIIELIIIIIIIIIIIGTIAAIIFINAIIKPVIELTKSAEAISNGNLEQKIYIKTEDEIGKLGIAFNKMTENLKKHQNELLTAKQKIEEYSKNLENKVRERTSELEESITELKDSHDVMLSILEDFDDARINLENTLTELKEKKNQLVQAGKLSGIGEMAAGIAHEINNPLTSILGCSQLIMLKKDLPPELMENLQIIEIETKRCVNIIDNLLSFAKPAETQKIPVNVNSILDMTLKIVEYFIKRDKIEIAKHYGYDLPKVIGNKNQLEQVFMNIIINAVNAMQGGGLLKIETRIKNDKDKDGHKLKFVEICFEDTGHGISKEIQEKIFDPFFSTAYKYGKKGTGLGLSISYSIIKEHNGVIEVESEEKKGSTFKITLPAQTNES